MSPLHIACQYNNHSRSVIEFLLQNDDSEQNHIRKPTIGNDLPVHLACKYNGSLEVIQLLLDSYNEAIYIRGKKGSLPLHFACSGVDKSAVEDVVALLIKKYPNSVSVRDYQGYLPLHYAIERNLSLSVIQLLVPRDYQSGPSRLLTSKHKTVPGPLEFARQRCHADSSTDTHLADVVAWMEDYLIMGENNYYPKFNEGVSAFIENDGRQQVVIEIESTADSSQQEQEELFTLLHDDENSKTKDTATNLAFEKMMWKAVKNEDEEIMVLQPEENENGGDDNTLARSLPEHLDNNFEEGGTITSCVKEKENDCKDDFLCGQASTLPPQCSNLLNRKNWLHDEQEDTMKSNHDSTEVMSIPPSPATYSKVDDSMPRRMSATIIDTPPSVPTDSKEDDNMPRRMSATIIDTPPSVPTDSKEDDNMPRRMSATIIDKPPSVPTDSILDDILAAIIDTPPSVPTDSMMDDNTHFLFISF
jgi:ankyrin repeat protein